ncbi:MAG: redoxin domain-containing protein [Beijerinckiaceae bacterium]|nr:redoxin domain-containing protein [Beijerinckiaceae bacterium]
MAIISRRLFLIVPPAALAATWFGEASEGIESIDAPPLVGAKHVSGAPVKGFRHAQLKGSVTIIHALASSRPECRDEVALWHNLVHEHRFQIAGLFVRDTEADARDFIARTGNPYDALAFDADGRVERQLGVRDVPSTFVVDAGGKIIHVLRGPLTREYFARTMLPIIEDASPIAPLLA